MQLAGTGSQSLEGNVVFTVASNRKKLRRRQKKDEMLASLTEIFPKLDRHLVAEILNDCHNDFDRAMQMLLPLAQTHEEEHALQQQSHLEQKPKTPTSRSCPWAPAPHKAASPSATSSAESDFLRSMFSRVLAESQCEFEWEAVNTACRPGQSMECALEELIRLTGGGSDEHSHADTVPEEEPEPGAWHPSPARQQQHTHKQERDSARELGLVTEDGQQKLREMFPEASDETLRHVLVACGGDVERAAESLLEGQYERERRERQRQVLYQPDVAEHMSGRRVISFRALMDEEMARQLAMEDQHAGNGVGADFSGHDLAAPNMAAALYFKTLRSRFPTLDEGILRAAFSAYDNDLETTTQILDALYDGASRGQGTNTRNEVVASQAQECPSQNSLLDLSRADPRLPPDEFCALMARCLLENNVKQRGPRFAERVKAVRAESLQAALRLRKAAESHVMKRNDFFREATRRFRDHQATRATELSEQTSDVVICSGQIIHKSDSDVGSCLRAPQGWAENDRMRLIGHMAMKQAIWASNAGADTRYCLDVHGLTVKEAVMLVSRLLPALSQQVKQTHRPGNTPRTYTLITGVGIHSPQGPKLMPAMLRYLRDAGFEFSTGQGDIKVNLTSRRRD